MSLNEYFQADQFLLKGAISEGRINLLNLTIVTI
jgi:hypothetical protein